LCLDFGEIFAYVVLVTISEQHFPRAWHGETLVWRLQGKLRLGRLGSILPAALFGFRNKPPAILQNLSRPKKCGVPFPIRGVPWKSGASAPRKACKLNPASALMVAFSVH